MFKAVLKETTLLKDSVDTISQIIGEGVFKIDKGGISMVAADRAMVAVVDFKLSASSFETFDVTGPTSLGINVENLLQILKRAKSTDKLELSLTEDRSKMNIKMTGETNRKFSIPLLDIPEGEIPPITQLEFTTKLQIKTPVVEESVSDASIVSDSLIFETNGETLTLKTDGDISSAETHVDKNSGLLSISGKPARARYPLDYLKKMLKAGKISDVATINFGKDFPLRLDFVNPEKVSMSFILAPRVED